MGAKTATANAVATASPMSAVRRDPTPAPTTPVSTPLAKATSEQRVDERRYRGALGQHDQHRQQQHRDHDRPEPPLLANPHEGPQLAEDGKAAALRLRHSFVSWVRVVGSGSVSAQSSAYSSRQSTSSWNSG